MQDDRVKKEMKNLISFFRNKTYIEKKIFIIADVIELDHIYSSVYEKCNSSTLF